MEREHEENDEYQTMMFEKDEDYLGFLKYIYEHNSGVGIGLEATDVPISASVRVRPSLLKKVPEDILNTMRPVNEGDVNQVMGQMTGDDIEDLKRFHFVSIPRD